MADRQAIINHVTAYSYLIDEGRWDDWFALFSDDVEASNSTPELGTVITRGSDTAFTWTLGGGADYPFTPHWSARGNLDFMRTHFAAAGQSRLRFVLGIAYTFGSREKQPMIMDLR